MGCYCSEIRKYKADINTLSRIRGQLEDADAINKTTITSNLEYAAVTSEKSVSPDNLEELKEEQQILNDGLKDDVDDQIESCVRRIAQMQRTLADYIVRDIAYHASK